MSETHHVIAFFPWLYTRTRLLTYRFRIIKKLNGSYRSCEIAYFPSLDNVSRFCRKHPRRYCENNRIQNAFRITPRLITMCSLVGWKVSAACFTAQPIADEMEKLYFTLSVLRLLVTLINALRATIDDFDDWRVRRLHGVAIFETFKISSTHIHF
jgi:hypothetical protein